MFVFAWSSYIFEDNMVQWNRNHKNIFMLPFFTIWEVWRERNKFIFQDISPIVVHVSIKVATHYLEFLGVRHVATPGLLLFFLLIII